MTSNTNTPNKYITIRPILKNVIVPPLIIKKTLFSNREDSKSSSSNSDNEFRSPRKPPKNQSRPTKTHFSQYQTVTNLSN